MCVCVCAWSGKLVWIQIFSPVFRSRVSRRAPLVNDPNETSVAWGRGEEGYLHARLYARAREFHHFFRPPPRCPFRKKIATRFFFLQLRSN